MTSQNSKQNVSNRMASSAQALVAQDRNAFLQSYSAHWLFMTTTGSPLMSQPLDLTDGSAAADADKR